MSYQSTKDENFLRTVSEWITSEGEVLALIRFSAAGGNKSWEFFEHLDAFKKRMDELPPQTCVIVFRHHQLHLRGIVDEAYITKALADYDAMPDCLLVCLDQMTIGKLSWHHWSNIGSKEELDEELRNMTRCFGKRVALGPDPSWLNTSEGLVDAVVPMQDGTVITGVY